MNAAGGGTNKPKIMQGVSYAAGGGMVGKRKMIGDSEPPSPEKYGGTPKIMQGVSYAGGGMIGDDKDTSSTQPLVGNYKIAFDTIQSNFPAAKPYHIAAAIGNFETEAPGLKPNTYQIGGGPGRGIAQWETPGRWNTAKKKYGNNIINNLGQQLNFMKWEMDTGHPDAEGRPNLPYGYATKDVWLNSKTLNEATLNFMNAYEAPGVPHTKRRLKNAQNILSAYKKSSKKDGKENKSLSKQKEKKPNIIERGISGVKKFLGFNEGGMIKEDTGIDIPGATADRQLIAVQPGEHNFIIPEESVERGAIPLINMIVAATDSNSKAYKDGFKSRIPGPPVKSSSKVTFINAGVNNSGDTTLPPAVSGAPSFDATSASRSKVRTLGLINF